MPTIYQRIQEFYVDKPNFRFSKKKVKHIAALVMLNYDSKGDKLPPISYTESVEDGVTFKVRDYPLSNIPHIDKIILKIYNRVQEKLIQEPPSIKPKRTRKTSSKKPVFSSKKSTLPDGKSLP